MIPLLVMSYFPQNSRRGFTLVEALVALGVFAFAVMGFMLAFESALQAAREVRREALIRQILEDRIAWLEHAPLTPTENRIEGPLPGMIIREVISPEEMLDEERTILIGFWRMRVLVEWPGSTGTETLEAGFLRYGP
jgi:prepilin-type N-terminal cleavage/methylation domain-containing protein